MNKNVSTLCRSLFIAAAMLAGFTACSDDDEPAILADISMNATAFDLDQAGNATIEFTVEPADAEVAGVDVQLNNGQSLTASGLTAVGAGVWRIGVQVADVKSFGASQYGTLTARQTDGTSVQTSFVLADPFAVPEDAFHAHYPYTVSWCDAATQTAMRLPIILSGEGANVGDIADAQLLLDSSSPRLNSSDLVFGKSATGEYGLFLDQKKVDSQWAEHPEQYFSVNAHIELTMKSGRVAHVPLNFMFSAPQATYKNEALSFNASDIGTTGYETELTLTEAVQTWRRIGFYDGPGEDYSGTMDFTDYGFFAGDDGMRVDDGDFFFAMPDLQNEADEIMVSGDITYVYIPGVYHYVYHMKADWEYGGKTYERIRADFRYEVTLK